MKKTIAMIAALIMAGSVLTACGSSNNGGSDSAAATTTVAAEESKAEESKSEESMADESKAEESKAEESKADESKAEEAVPELGPLTAAYNENVSANNYSMKIKLSAMAIESEMRFDRCGDDYYADLDIFGMHMQVYKVGDKAVTLLPDADAYLEGDGGIDISQLDTYVVPADSTYVGSEEVDGFIVETYTTPFDMGDMEIDETDSESGASDVAETKYYYDELSNLKKIVTTAPFVGESIVEFEDLSFMNTKIEMPDTSKLTVYDPENPDPVVAGKLVCAFYGVTEDMLKKAGESYESVGKMDDETVQETLGKIASDNGLDVEEMFDELTGEFVEEDGTENAESESSEKEEKSEKSEKKEKSAE